MSGALPFPIVMTSAGVQPQTPAALLSQLLASVAVTNPGYTGNLPGSLIDDISGTDVAAIALCDAAWVELVNSLTPYGANLFLLNQLGQVYGVAQGKNTNVSVYLIFSGTAGFVVSPGFTVSDGTNQYIARDGGIVGASGLTTLLFFVAAQPGSWAVPPNTVNQLVTSVPGGVTLAVNNPSAGIPSLVAQTPEDYRAQVLQAGLATSTGSVTLLKTALQNVVGVQSRLVAVRMIVGTGWQIICGDGGDPYQIGYAIFSTMFDLFSLVGSVLAVVAINNASPGMITTSLNHGYVTGQVINITGVIGMSGINNTPITITVLGLKSFTVGFSTVASGVYASGGVITPNTRNVVATVIDSPDTYNIPYVVPPVQTVTMTVVWNTTATNLVSTTAVVALAQPALLGYINDIAVGQPININSLQDTFQEAVVSLLPRELLTRLIFTISINGISTPPSVGTFVVIGDPESYFVASVAGITITQG